MMNTNLECRQCGKQFCTSTDDRFCSEKCKKSDEESQVKLMNTYTNSMEKLNALFQQAADNQNYIVTTENIDRRGMDGMKFFNVGVYERVM